MRSRIAWLLVPVSGACLLADTFISAAYESVWSERAVAQHGWPLISGAAFGCCLMGALILSRYPGQIIGWLLAVMGATGAVSQVSESYSIWVVEARGPGPRVLAHIAGWVSTTFGASVAVTGVTLMFLVAPDGRFRSPRWRIVAGLSLLGLAGYVAAVCLVPPWSFVVQGDVRQWSLAAGILATGGVLISTAMLVASAVCLVLRLRDATGVVRQQLRWVAVSAVLLAVTFVWLVVEQGVNGGRQDYVASLPLFSAFFLFPIFMAVAVLRYRMYGIEVIINRAVVLTIGTAFAAAGYIALVVGVGALVGSRTRGYWPSLAAAVLVSLAFQPLRRRVVRVADRVAYGVRAAPYEALADFTRQLAESVAPDALLPLVAAAAGEAVGARTATARLDAPEGTVETSSRSSATWSSSRTEGAGQAAEFPVLDKGEHLGTIEVVMPVGRPLRRRERRLMADLAEQAALAFRNARLSAQLVARVEMLDRRTAELARSRARIIAARDAERARLARAIGRDVTSHLESLPEELAALALAPEAGSSEGRLDRLIDESVTALERLREITRGVFPTQLARSGLAVAISGHLGRSGREGAVVVAESAADLRCAPRVEAAAYFCYLEAARELRPPLAVTLAVADGALHLAVAGEAGAAPDLEHLADRVEALEGAVEWERHGDTRVRLVVRLPVSAPDALDARV